MDSLETQLKLPDLWQQQAIRALQSGRDVVVAAPTGAGKTYIFEMLIEGGFDGRAVYTVPTRALANDKRLEWMRSGWSVGLATGDRTDKLEAPVIVATLETQKHPLLRGQGPDLLVVDEYQMLGDPQRGLNYELAIACAPPSTRLLLLSGSVGNPQDVAAWLTRLGRRVELVRHGKRPVPLEEVNAEAINERIPESVRGLWPRVIAKALKAGMAPLLAFAPRRKAAEDLAFEIARQLPEEDPLVLTPEQAKLAGEGIRSLLRARVAYHHSGLDYGQRAGLIEPLAKAGQLRVVVATMGLAAGINFSMRSVLVTDRQYRSGDQLHEVRPDELLQMFGRAGRRGMDKVGYIVVAPGKPRLQESRPLRLKRTHQVDWPSLIGVMQTAIEQDRDPIASARALVARLYSIQQIPLGLEGFQKGGPRAASAATRLVRQTLVEIGNPDGQWERKRPLRPVPLKDCLVLEKGLWKPALTLAGTLGEIRDGTLCRLPGKGERRFGRMVPLARWGSGEPEGELVLTRWALKHLKSDPARKFAGRRRDRRTGWTLDRVESEILPRLPEFTLGGRFHSWRERGDTLYALLYYDEAVAMAHLDASGRGLLNPPERQVEHVTDLSLPEDLPAGTGRPETVAETWHRLGLIDDHGHPTRRGLVFSFFNYGEGLCIAAALEDAAYAIDDLLPDLANLRAGHRFEGLEGASGRLGAVCRGAFGFVTYPGYLFRGLPATYGEGASEILFQPGARQAFLRHHPELRNGDLERVRLEWRSILRHIVHAPRLNWDRWLELQEAARREVEAFPKASATEDLPPLTSRQRQRHKSFLIFEDAPRVCP